MNDYFDKMSKRFGKNQNDKSIHKRPRLEIQTNHGESFRRHSSISPSAERKAFGNVDDDDWGEDFGAEELEEIDIIASQACSQDVNLSFQPFNPQPGPSGISTFSNKQDSFTLPLSAPVANFADKMKFSYTTKPQASQIISSSTNLRPIVEDEPVLSQFKKNLIAENKLNSTFQIQCSNANDNNNVDNSVSETHEDIVTKHEKLAMEYKKLLNDFTLKEGETIFLRQQLQQTQTKASKDSMEKTKLMELQAGEFREKINALHKETESWKTQFKLQTFDLNKYAEKCRTFEISMTKLMSSPTKNSPMYRRSTVDKSTDVFSQTEYVNSHVYFLKLNIPQYQFKKIPQTIFELSLPEKAIIDVQVVNRSGKRNLPILQDSQSVRMFENPGIVKPVVTIVDGKNLCVEYIQPDVAKLINSDSDTIIHSRKTIFTINKIVAVTRELLLNIQTVLDAIKQAMNNDDVRDMNDIYFSNFYDTQVNYNQSLCDSNEWDEKERGIEARRALGILSIISEKSNYLNEYIAGKCQLCINDDIEYEKLNKQMVRYKKWRQDARRNSKDNEINYEALEIIEKLVSAISCVRRAHQFTGLICGICEIIKNTQRNVGFNSRALKYVSNIFRDLVYSRPLVRCLISMTEMLVEFSECEIFINRLTTNVNRHALHVWKNILNFTEDACVLKIFVNQFKGYKFDELTIIQLTHELVIFTDTGFRLDILPWPSELNNDYDCSVELLTLVVKMLFKASAIDLDAVKNKFIKPSCSTNVDDIYNNCDNRYLEKSFWHELKRKQLSCIKMGIRFLSYLTRRDPEFLIRSIDIDTPFFLFVENVTAIDQLKCHDVDREALSLIKSTFVYEKPLTPDHSQEKIRQILTAKAGFAEKTIPSPKTGTLYEFRRTHDENRQMTEMFASLLQI